MLSNLRSDIRYTLRTLSRNPGFAAAAIVPIALGIGLNTAVFSVLNSVAWRPLPVPDAGALVSIHQEFRGGPRRTVHGARALFSIPEYRAYRDGAQTLTDVMAYSRRWSATVHRDSPREVEGILVTCNYFDVLGISPAIGTGFTASNCGADVAPVVVLSHALWAGAFGADPRILQKPIVLNGRAVTVVGVAPAGFDGVDMAKAAFFAPAAAAVLFGADPDLHENPHVSWLTLIGRRRSDASIEQVRAELSTIARQIDQQQAGRTTTLIVEPAAALSLPVQRRGVLMGAAVVMAAFGLVLLIAAANVANILLARGASRSREIAIRMSIGANRRRLLQQLLTESAIIAGAGAGCGTILFSWSFQVLVPWLLTAVPGAEPLRIDATLDLNVFAFALVIAVVTALVFGLVPALQTCRQDVHAAMKLDVLSATSGRDWMRAMLVGGQIALCTLLLIPAGLLSRALDAAYEFDPGFDHDDVAVVSIALRDRRYEGSNAALFREQWMERLRSVPGVENVASASRIPLSPGRSQTTMRIGGGGAEHVIDVNAVTPEFFSVLGLPIVRGRVFADTESNAVLVTEPTARRYWPGQDALGQAVTIDGTRRVIVGVVGNVRLSQSEAAMRSYVFLPGIAVAQRIVVLARTGTDFETFAAAVRDETRRMDPGLAVNVSPLSETIAFLQTLSQVAASGAGVVGALAVCLASSGLYGVVAYVLSRRRREIGVRMALGATARDVHRLMRQQMLRPVAFGLAIGVACAAAGAQVLRSVLFGVSPYDPVAFIGAPALVLAIAAVTAFAPTRRTLRADPVAVLRD